MLPNSITLQTPMVMKAKTTINKLIKYHSILICAETKKKKVLGIT